MKALLLVLLLAALVALTYLQILNACRGRRIRAQRADEDEAYDHETGRDKRGLSN